MTLEAIRAAIGRLILARAAAHGNKEEQNRINAKLDKLYNLKYILLSQIKKQKNGSVEK